MKESTEASRHKNSKAGYLLIFLLLLAIGVCLIAWQNTLKGLAIAIGAILSAFGIVLAIFTLAHRERNSSYALRIFFSAICLIGGIVVIVANDKAISVIVSLSSLLLIVDASFKLNTTAMSKRYSVPLWWIILAFSVAVIAGGYYLLEVGFSDILTTSKMLGAVFTLDSVSNLLSAFFISAYERRQYVESYLDFYQTKDNPPKSVKKIIKKQGLKTKAERPASENEKTEE